MTFNKTANVIIGGVQLAVFFSPAYYVLCAVLEMKFQLINPLYLSLFLAVLAGIAACVSTISEDKKQALLKWAVSVPLSVVSLIWIFNSNFFLRVFAFYNPAYYYDYGTNAGNGLGYILVFFWLAMAVLIGIIVGISLSGNIRNEMAKPVIRKLQLVVCSVMCIAILAFLIYLLIAMPVSPDRDMG